MHNVRHSGVGRMHSLSTRTDCWDKEYNPQQWCTLYASVEWADQRERLGPHRKWWRGGIVLWQEAGSTPSVDAHQVPRIMAACRNFQNLVVGAARAK